MDILEIIQNEMQDRGLTISDVSKGANVNRSQFSNYYNKKSSLTDKNIQKVFDYLGLEPVKTFKHK